MYINKDSTCFSLKLSELCLLLTVCETANEQTLLARIVEVVTKNFNNYCFAVFGALRKYDILRMLITAIDGHSVL